MISKNKITYNTIVYFGNLNLMKNNQIIRDSNVYKTRKWRRLSDEILNNEYNPKTKTSSYGSRSALIYGSIIGDFFVGQYNNCKNAYNKFGKKNITRSSRK